MSKDTSKNSFLKRFAMLSNKKKSTKGQFVLSHKQICVSKFDLDKDDVCGITYFWKYMSL